MSSPLYTVDVAHPPRHPDLVVHTLEDAWREVRNSPERRVLKIIHGYGSSGKGGSTRTLVRNWAFNHRKRFKAVIDGEAYTLYDDATREMRATVGQYDDPDLAHGNPGILVIWVR